MRRFVAGLLALALALGAPQAQGEQAAAPGPAPAPAPTAEGSGQAEAIFQEGRALLSEGRYAEACRKFEQSQELDPASGTQLALAYCQEQAGWLASAWKSYRAAEELALREGHAERQSVAAERARGLEPRLSTLTIVVPSSLAKLPGLRLTLDGVELQAQEFGTAIQVDGGAHAIEAAAPEHEPWSERVTVERERHRKTVIVPALPPLGRSAAADANGGSDREAKTPSPATPAQGAARGQPSSRSSELEHASLALAAGSVVAAGVGAFFGLRALAKNDASNEDGHCDRTGCDPRGVELRNEALDAARASTWSFVASGALALGSVALYLGSSATRTEAAASVSAGLGEHGPRLAFTKSF